VKNPNAIRIFSCLALGIALTAGISQRGYAQQAVSERESQTATAKFPTIPSRVITRVDDSKLVRLTGNTNINARPEFDHGPVAADLPMERMQLLLKRSPAQETALQKFMEDQMNPASPNFHHWLNPDEFGALYGPSDADIAAVTTWLEGHGFSIYKVSRGRTHIEFSGTAAQVQEAFHLEMHNYRVNNEEHIANDRDPSIPTALSPVVTGVVSLHNFFPKHQSVLGKFVKRNIKTGKITPVDSTAKPSGRIRNMYTYDDAGAAHEDITPWDFATIYNLIPLWNAGIDGTGQTIVIPALSDIEQSDINSFRSSFDLPAKTITVYHNGTDPGVATDGSNVENTLDVEWSGAAAKNANIIMVVSKTTATTYGGELSQQYVVDNVDTLKAYISSASYGGCEILQGTAGNAALNAIFQQGAAEGMTMFVSAGDQGSTGCDNSDAHPSSQATVAPADYGLNANAWATPPYVTGVGGTDFAWQYSPTLSTYWNASNNTTNQSTAKGYIPELPWNSTCTSSFLVYANSSIASSAEELCNYVYNDATDYIGLVKVTGGSGGVSNCTTSDGSTFASCSGGYPKPSWQKGTGVPADGKRDVPDVSLFASGGFPDGLDGSAYLMCVASSDSPYGCNYAEDVASGNIIYEEVGGTSVSSPAMAGIMALVQQKMGGKAQGVANPVLYALAAKSSCSSNTDSNSSSCIFHDVTTGATETTLPGTNEQVCETNQPVGSGLNARNCTAANTTDMFGVTTGYNATAGYDLTTGLGSVNAYNLVNAWASATTTTTYTLSLAPTSVAFGSLTVGSTSAAQVVTVKNTGTGALTLTSETVSAPFLKSATTCGTSLAVGASCTVSIEFKPTSATSSTGTLVVASNGTSTPASVSLTGTGTAALTHTLSLAPTSVAFGSLTLGSTSAAQVVTVKNTGTGALTLTSETVSAPFLKSATTCGTSLAVGASCTVSIEFKPTAATSSTGTLVVASNGTSTPASVSLTGTGTAVATPTLTLTPTSIAFPNTIVGTTSDATTVVVKNTSTVTVTLSSIALSGSYASSFELLDTCGATLAASASCNLYIAFKPASAAALSATVLLTDTATGSPQKVTLTGTGTAAPSVKLSATTLAFSTTTHGTTSDALPVTLTNAGTATLTLTSITLTGTNPTDFEALNTCGATLAPAASCTVYVGFKPAAVASYSAKLTIADNGAASPQSVTLTGTGK
jgi:subtilase family serine protease